MKKILLQFADAQFLVDPDTAARVQQVVPADRYVTSTTIEEPPELPPLGQRKPSSVFERHQPNLTAKEKQYACDHRSENPVNSPVSNSDIGGDFLFRRFTQNCSSFCSDPLFFFSLIRVWRA